eukprot:TRINITY_DN8679_c0_g1_i6.p1 TRINITY_DN8679_c0_g1~~TRINITY_DN8679_c0_g1_i6.p1  ORF type:complete len:816 (+),score=175.96 TRINITY_DN8679_c0_g1_i6:89-2536(+)
MIRRPPRSTLSSSSAASDVYKRQAPDRAGKWGRRYAMRAKLEHTKPGPHPDILNATRVASCAVSPRAPCGAEYWWCAQDTAGGTILESVAVGGALTAGPDELSFCTASAQVPCSGLWTMEQRDSVAIDNAPSHCRAVRIRCGMEFLALGADGSASTVLKPTDDCDLYVCSLSSVLALPAAAELKLNSAHFCQLVCNQVIGRLVRCKHGCVGSLGAILCDVGIVKKSELTDLQHRSFYVGITALREVLPQLATRLFTFLDLDNSGELEWREVQYVFQLLMGESAWWDALFDVMDIDKNGQLSPEEVVEFVRALFTCLVDFGHSAVHIAEKTGLEVWITPVLEHVFLSIGQGASMDATTIEQAVQFLESTMLPHPAVCSLKDKLQAVSWTANTQPASRPPLSNDNFMSDDTPLTGFVLYPVLFLLSRSALTKELGLVADAHSDALVAVCDKLIQSSHTEVLGAIFAVLDHDGDGELSPEELACAEHLLRPDHTSTGRSKVQDFVSLLDVNQDGSITLVEARQVLKRMLSMIINWAHMTVTVFATLVDTDEFSTMLWDLLKVHRTDGPGAVDLSKRQFQCCAQRVVEGVRLSIALDGQRQHKRLFEAWIGLCKEIKCSDEVAMIWWRKLETLHGERGHEACDFRRLKEMLDVMNQLQVTAPVAVGFGMFFHEAVVDPTGLEASQKESAELWEQFCIVANAPMSAVVQARAIIKSPQWVLLEEQRIEGIAFPDARVFSDMKLAPYACSLPAAYEEFVRAQRLKMSCSSDHDFFAERAQLLQGLLNGRTVMSTPEGVELYESLVQRNMQHELNRLRDNGY